MKNKKLKKIFLCCISISVITILFYTELFGNAWYLLTHTGYFIPEESNIFTFNATQMNEGSGGWWLYGEDKMYYYALNTEPAYSPRYFKQAKGKEPTGFDRYDYKTWNIK